MVSLKIFGSKNFWDQKYLWVKKNFDQKNFESKIFGSKTVLGQKKILTQNFWVDN